MTFLQYRSCCNNAILRVFAEHHAPQWMVQAELITRVLPFPLDSLLIGALLALLWRGAYRQQLLTIARYLAAIGTILLAIYAVYIALTAWPYVPENFHYPKWAATWGLCLINFYSASLLLSALRTNSVVYKLLSIKPLRWVGRISYGAYVFHDILHNAYYHFVLRGAVHLKIDRVVSQEFLQHFSLGLSFVGTLTLAYLSFRFFESPFLNLKERWTIRS